MEQLKEEVPSVKPLIVEVLDQRPVEKDEGYETDEDRELVAPTVTHVSTHEVTQ